MLFEFELNNAIPEEVPNVSRQPGQVLQDWPNRLDLQNSMQSLIHIQDVYNFRYPEVS
jgi:hypothetical protein